MLQQDQANTVARQPRMARVETPDQDQRQVAETKDALGTRLAALAGRDDSIVEWTLRPQNLDEASRCGCGCIA